MTELIETLASLVQINSVNSAYEGGVGEKEIGEWIERFFKSRGIETFRQTVFPGRDNIIACVPGTDRSRRVVLEAHMDTVSIEGMTIDPFEPRIEYGRLFGRGSCDTKAGLAAMMHTLVDVSRGSRRLPFDLWLAAVVDEEYSFRGVVKLCESLDAEAAIVAEPTELRAVIASKGVLRWRIITTGKAAHSSKPHLGKNAIEAMVAVIGLLQTEQERLKQVVHPLLGPATLNIGTIRGGVQVNFVPDKCAIEIDRRLLPGESAVEVIAGIEELLSRLRNLRPDIEVFQETPMLVDEALDTPAESRVAQHASAVLQRLKLSGELAGVPYGSDASKLSRHGIPTVLFGPGSIDQAHAAVEYIEIDQVETALEFYRSFVMDWQ